jgi:hypothetical protein
MKLNPYLAESDIQKITNLTVDVLFHAVRLGQIRRSITEARGLYLNVYAQGYFLQ